MTIVFRSQVGVLERHDCDTPGCTMPAGYSYKIGIVEAFVCAPHDLLVAAEFAAEPATMVLAVAALEPAR